jgi:hypothetical protein
MKAKRFNHDLERREKSFFEHEHEYSQLTHPEGLTLTDSKEHLETLIRPRRFVS